MKTIKAFKLALNILLHSKLRSWLTIIGIVIGVAAVVAIVSIGEGLQKSVQDNLGSLGADLITLSPGGGGASGGFRMGGGGNSIATSASTAKNITEKDIQVIKGIDGVAVISGTVSASAEVFYLGERLTSSITGVDPVAWQQVTTSSIAEGRFLGPSDSYQIVIGNSLAKDTFKEDVAINRVMTIEGKSFKVVGILKASGGFGGSDRTIIMPIKVAREVLEDVGNNEFDSVSIKASSRDSVIEVMESIISKLLVFRHVGARDKDFRLSSSQQTQESITQITGTITLFLGAIAAVSLLVGAVGIANTMFTSVLEKTKEIGIMKAIGAKNRDIMTIFILNAAMVGMVGGLLGIALGVLLSSVSSGLIAFGPGSQGASALVTPRLLIFALGISVSIGIIAGAIPAYRASKLKPVDALRYE